jgi:hypothetical protein
MMANIQIPIEIFDSGNYRILTDHYSISFSRDLPEELIASSSEENGVEEENEPVADFQQAIAQILSEEIKPRRNRVNANASLRKRTSCSRFSRKCRDPIRIHSSSDKEVADSSVAKTDQA